MHFLWVKMRQMCYSIYLLVECHSLVARTLTRIMLFGHTTWDWHSIMTIYLSGQKRTVIFLRVLTS
jgi:hypothetical protein